MTKENILSQEFCKEAILGLLRVIANQSSELALIIVNSNDLQAIVECMEDVNPRVKDAAIWALGYIARYDPNLAQLTVDAGNIIVINIYD